MPSKPALADGRGRRIRTLSEIFAALDERVAGTTLGRCPAENLPAMIPENFVHILSAVAVSIPV